MAILHLQQVYKQLDGMEAAVLTRWDRWLKQTFRPVLSLPRFLTPEWIETFACASGLSRIVGNHVVASYQTGRMHGKEAARIARKNRPIPEVTRLSRPPDVPLFVIPEAAITELKKRELHLAGNVEQDIVNGVKGALYAHLQGQSRQETEVQIQKLLDSNRTRASLITTTETTYAYNRGRLSSFAEAGVDYVRFSAVMDSRTSIQCRGRHGLIMAMNDSRLADNVPPLHARCRSILDPIYSVYQPEVITPEVLNWSKAESLPSGWGGRRQESSQESGNHLPSSTVSSSSGGKPPPPPATGGGRSGGGSNESQHPVDRMIRNVMNVQRKFTSDELKLIREHIGQADMSSRPVKITHAGVLEAAKELGVQVDNKRIATDQAHWLKHVVVEKEWPVGTSFPDYIRDLRYIASHPNAEISTYMYLKERFISFFAPLPDEEQAVFVAYSASYGKIKTGFKTSDTMEKLATRYTWDKLVKHTEGMRE